jgi:hypothetical protein
MSWDCAAWFEKRCSPCAAVPGMGAHPPFLRFLRVLAADFQGGSQCAHLRSCWLMAFVGALRPGAVADQAKKRR